MRTEKSGNDVHPLVFVIIQAAHHTELQQLGFFVQPVSAFALDGGHSHSAHLFQKSFRLAAQLDKVALTGGFHRTDNTAATLHNGHIAFAPQPPGKLFGTLPAKDEMRMRIDKTRQKTLAAGIVMPVTLIIAVALFATIGAYVGNDAAGDFHRSVIHDAKFFHFPAVAGGKANRSHDTGIEDDKVLRHIFRFKKESGSYSIILASSTCRIEKFSSPR